MWKHVRSAECQTPRMTYNTATEEGRAKRLNEIVEGYKQSGNKTAIVRLIGGSVEDLGDYSPEDNGGDPAGYRKA